MTYTTYLPSLVCLACFYSRFDPVTRYLWRLTCQGLEWGLPILQGRAFTSDEANYAYILGEASIEKRAAWQSNLFLG